METNKIEVSVIIVARNEAQHIVACIESVSKQFDNNEKWELIVVDGLSVDDTKLLAEKTCCECHVTNYKIIDNPKKILAAGWNKGIEISKGQYVIRPDAHAKLFPDYIRKGIEILKEKNDVGCVGGSLITLSKGFWGNIIKEALSSKVGVGNSSFRVGARSGYQDTAVYGLYRKEVFNKTGLFNEKLTRHQDNEFHQRVHDAGYKFWMEAEMKAGYYCRDNIKSLLNQMFKIGYYLPDLITKNSASGIRLRHFAPGLFFLAIIVGVILGSLIPVFLFPAVGFLILYFLIMIGNALFVSFKNTASCFLNLAWIIPAMHFSYFLGTLSGFIKKIFLSKQK